MYLCWIKFKAPTIIDINIKPLIRKDKETKYESHSWWGLSLSRIYKILVF